MKITGLITEYNPFHNGHLYHLETSRKETGADYLIALMSASFVQRGAPAVYDKYARASMALESGADLVLEMPVSFSTAPAREFSAFAVALFTALGAVDCVSFGSECGDTAPLLRIASLLADESDPFSRQLRQGLRQGLTWPESREQALSPSLSREEQALLLSPNNILGIEYCLAAIRQNSPLKLHTVKRQGSAYHDQTVENLYPSATAIRALLASEKKGAQAFALLEGKIPPSAAAYLQTETPIFPNDFSLLLNCRILAALEESLSDGMAGLSEIADMTPELASRIRKTALSPFSFEERIKTVKSRQFTYTRVSRALLHLLLNLKESDRAEFKCAGYAPYARILGFRKTAGPLLSCLKQKSSIPLITKLADAKKRLGGTGLAMLRQEIAAAHLYQHVKAEKGCAFKNEYTQPIIIL